MGIEAYRSFADQAVARGEGSLAIVDRPHQEGLGIQHATNPPGRMVCWLANHPRLPMSDRAYARVNGFLDQSKTILAGFVSDLRASYGTTIADACLHDAGGVPLTARKIKEVIEHADQMLSQNRSSHRVMNGFLGVFDPNEHIGDARRAPAAGQSRMDHLFADEFGRSSSSNSTHHLGTLNWRSFAPPEAAAVLCAHIEARCAALPSYAAGHLTDAEVDAVARQATGIYFENAAETRGEIGALKQKLAAAPPLSAAAKRPHMWTKPYPPPTGKDLRDLPHAQCRKDLLAFAEGAAQRGVPSSLFPPREAARTTTNLQFLEEVVRFRQNPTREALNTLFHQFLDPDSDQQIYLDGVHLKDTMSRVFALRIPSGSSEEGVDPTVFDAAFEEIANRVEQIVLPAFLENVMNPA